MVLPACVMGGQNEQELRTRAPGSYSATAQDGTALTLQLNADGTGSVNGQPGTWNIQYGRIFLSDGKQSVPADLSGDQLTVYLPDGQVVFTRVGTAPAAGTAIAGAAGAPLPAGPARAFAPERTLPGKPMTIAEQGMAFTVPDGWTHAPSTDAQGWSYVMRWPAASGQGGLQVTRMPLSAADRQSPPSQLLQKGLTQMNAQARVELAEDLDIGGQRGGRVIAKTGDGANEIYLAGVVVGSFGYTVAAFYEVGKAAELRPGVETVLASLRASTPPENTDLKAKLAGCWENVGGSGGGTGSSSSTTRLALAADGSFQYRSFVSVSAGGMSSSSDSKASGTYRVEGSTLYTDATEGDSGSYDVSFQGGILMLNGLKYLPCSG